MEKEADAIEIPKFALPGWTGGDLALTLYEVPYYYVCPTYPDKERLRRHWCEHQPLSFAISARGVLTVCGEDTYSVFAYTSDAENPHHRLNALLLYSQFEDVIKILMLARTTKSKHATDADLHAVILDDARNAFRKLIPGLVAEELKK